MLRNHLPASIGIEYRHRRNTHQGKSPRKLVAVLAANVFGYSRLMQAHDQATLRALTD